MLNYVRHLDVSLKTKILLLCLHAVEIPAEGAFGKVQTRVSLLDIHFSILTEENIKEKPQRVENMLYLPPVCSSISCYVGRDS